jgi:hypothetical protein
MSHNLIILTKFLSNFNHFHQFLIFSPNFPSTPNPSAPNPSENLVETLLN